MSIHIGNIIKEAVSISGMSITEFATRINYSRRNVYEIFEKKSIDTGVLMKISEVLGQNLFIHFLSEDELNQLKNQHSTINDFKILIEDLKNEIDRLKEVK